MARSVAGKHDDGVDDESQHEPTQRRSAHGKRCRLRVVREAG
jgi:hypothetical protein